MYPISLLVTTISFVPSVMMSATIAFSFDYSLFVLRCETPPNPLQKLTRAVHGM